MNSVVVAGNLGGDPETRTTAGGTVVTNFKVAVNERIKDGDEWKDHAEWFNVVCFGKTAENVAKYLKKGSGVTVRGSQRTRQYEKDGQTRYFTELRAEEIKFHGNGAKSDRYDGPDTKHDEEF